MTNSILSPDATYLKLNEPGEFQRFYQGRKYGAGFWGNSLGWILVGEGNGEWILSEDKRGRIGR